MPKALKKKLSTSSEKPRVRHMVEEVGVEVPPVIPDEVPSVQPPVEEIVETATPLSTEPQPQDSSVSSFGVKVPQSTLLPESEEKIGFFPLFLITLGVALLVAVLAGGIYVYVSGLQELPSISEADPTPKPLATQAPSASSTPVATVSASSAPAQKLNTYSVSVLNGNGRPGEAAKAKAVIEKAGFKVGFTGNASKTDFRTTMVQAKATVPASVVSSMKTALQGTYTVEDGAALPATNVFDIVVTVGTE
jgi:hypothetical protein